MHRRDQRIMRKTSRNLWIFCFLVTFWIFDCEALCGFNRTASLHDEILNTPGYPRNYNSSQDCQWTLRATPGYQVQFTVYSGESQACCDYLEVFDGPNMSSPSLGRVNGNVILSKLFASTARYLTVRFVSDDSIERRGFSGFYNLHLIKCVARSDPANSTSKPGKSLWFVNDNVTYSCQDGYQLFGSATSRCDDNGEWSSGLPVCVESRFHFTDVQLNFKQSRQHCRSLGGDLAMIYNQQEQDYLTAKAKRLYPDGVTFYIGLERVDTFWIFKHGYFQWINGKRVSDGFQNWNIGEPNYGAANEYCGTMFIAEETFWNDIACFRRFFAVCETDYNPCINNPCLNGGICSKGKNNFNCECPVYADGVRCENVLQCPAPVLHPSLNTVPSRNADSYRVGTRFNLTCDSGKVFVGKSKSIECQRNETWSGTSGFCSICEAKNFNDIVRFGLTCGIQCGSDRNCNFKERCLCDGSCSQSCVNPDIDCGKAPASNNATIIYTGQGFYRVAHYSCAEGFYLASGSPTRKCTGSGIYDGSLPECARIKCSDPFVAFQATGGEEPQQRPDNYSVDAQVEFRCPSTHRLLGSTSRTCLIDGRWSELDSACDVIDTTTRCPHPGVPINGRLLTNSNFSVGSVIQFSCDPGYLMVGDQEQECMYFLQWTDGGAPQCIDTDISTTNIQAIDQILNSLEEIPDSTRASNDGGRLSLTYSLDEFEIYFVIDMSMTSTRTCLNQSLEFFKRIHDRMYANEIVKNRINLIAYAEQAKVVYQSSPSGSNRTEIQVALNNLTANKEELSNELEMSQSVNRVLQLLTSMTKESSDMKRQIYFTICGERKKNTFLEKKDVKDFKDRFSKDKTEIFVILVCVECKQAWENNIDVLRSIASSNSHIFTAKYPYSVKELFSVNGIGDSKQARKETEAAESCGKAGNIKSVKRRVGNIIAGNKVKIGAWPWHAVITWNINSLSSLKNPRNIIGGGSLISDRWVLTAAHLFEHAPFGSKLLRGIRVILGMHQLGMNENQFKTNAKIFEPEEIILHENFKVDLSDGIYQDFDFDVALIKLGEEYELINGNFSLSANIGYVNYTDLIRPVCLPCMENNCVNGWLKSKGKWNSMIREAQSTEDKCENEKNEFLTDKQSLSVITGYGAVGFKNKMSNHLLQGRVNIWSHNECLDATSEMRHVVQQTNENIGQNFKYTDRMLCALGGSPLYVTDAGKGDSGGPLTREIYDEASKASCWIQLGIVSWGYDLQSRFMSNGTRRNFPGYYTNVFSVMNWIRSRISPQSVCDSSNLEAAVGGMGTLQSPNYPEKYPSNSECWTTITATAGYLIQMNFSVFDLENCGDHFLLYDASSRAAAAQPYASIRPEDDFSQSFLSLSRYVTLKFTSDATIERSGFQLTYRAVGIDSSRRSNNYTTVWCGKATWEIPGGVIEDMKIKKTDTKFDVRDFWIMIHTNESFPILLIFDYFDTEECCQLVQLYDSGTITSNRSLLIAEMKGSLVERGGPELVKQSRRNYMTLLHRTLRANIKGGFSGRIISGKCSDPVLPIRVSINGTRNVYFENDVIAFSCDQPDLLLRGEKSSRCQSNGQWSAEVPRCIHSCSIKNISPDITIQPQRAVIAAGDRVKFTCNQQGFNIVGSSTSTCDDDGYWTSVVPECRLPVQGNVTITKKQPDCPAGYRKQSPLCYKVIRRWLNHTDATAACEADGATLPVIRNSEMESVVNTIARSNGIRRYWLGLSKPKNIWRWADGIQFEKRDYGDYRSNSYIESRCSYVNTRTNIRWPFKCISGMSTLCIRWEKAVTPLKVKINSGMNTQEYNGIYRPIYGAIVGGAAFYDQQDPAPTRYSIYFVNRDVRWYIGKRRPTYDNHVGRFYANSNVTFPQNIDDQLWNSDSVNVKDVSIKSYVSCANLNIPNNVIINTNETQHFMDDVVRFSCSAQDLSLIGSTTSTCQSDGYWSREVPSCKR